MAVQIKLHIFDCSTLFVLICHVLTDVVRRGLIVIVGKFIGNDLCGNENCFELEGGSSYWCK